MMSGKRKRAKMEKGLENFSPWRYYQYRWSLKEIDVFGSDVKEQKAYIQGIALRHLKKPRGYCIINKI